MIITRLQSDLSCKQAVVFGFHSQALLSGFSLWQASKLTNNVGNGEGGLGRGVEGLEHACTSPARLSRVSHSYFAACAPGSNRKGLLANYLSSCQGPPG